MPQSQYQNEPGTPLHDVDPTDNEEIVESQIHLSEEVEQDIRQYLLEQNNHANTKKKQKPMVLFAGVAIFLVVGAGVMFAKPAPSKEPLPDTITVIQYDDSDRIRDFSDDFENNYGIDYINQAGFGTPQFMAFDQLIQLPVHLGSMLDAGWSISGDEYVESLAPGETKEIEILYHGGLTEGSIKVLLANPENVRVSIEQSQVIGYVFGSGYEFKVYTGGGVTIGESKYMLELTMKNNNVSFKQEGTPDHYVVSIDFPSDLKGYDTWRLTFEMVDDQVQGIIGQYVDNAQ